MYRINCQGWDRGRKDRFIGHMNDLSRAYDNAGCDDPLVVCMVDLVPYEFAFEVAERVPRSEVYVSVIPQGRSDDNSIHLTIPDPGIYIGYCSQHIPPGKGVGLYINNEPPPSGLVFEWLAEAGMHAAAMGHFAVLGNWSTTRPTPDQLRTPEAKRYMRVLADHADVLRNGVHEYAWDLPANPNGALGSHTKWDDAAAFHQIPTHVRIITECPWDGDTSRGEPRGIKEVLERMPEKGESAERKLARQFLDAMKAHWIHPNVRAWCFYMMTYFSDMAKDWSMFNPSEYMHFLDEVVGGMVEIGRMRMDMKAGFPAPVPGPTPGPIQEPEPEPNPGGIRTVLMFKDFGGLRFREGASTGNREIAILKNGAVVYRTGNVVGPSIEGGFAWHEARLPDRRLGWFAAVKGLSAEPPLPVVDNRMALAIAGITDMRNRLDLLLTMLKGAAS